MKIFGNFFGKNVVFGNFLTVKWQFSGGSAPIQSTASSESFCYIAINIPLFIHKCTYVFTCIYHTLYLNWILFTTYTFDWSLEIWIYRNLLYIIMLQKKGKVLRKTTLIQTYKPRKNSEEEDFLWDTTR